jgi:DNA-binding PucR family transcriptional regulator
VRFAQPGDVTPVKLLQMDQQFWKTEQTAIANHLDQFDFKLLDFYENSGPEHMITLTEIVAQLKDYGASVGMDDMVKTFFSKESLANGQAQR